MANTVIVRWQGFESGDEATAMYDAVHPTMMKMIGSGDYPGLTFHSCSKTDDGIVIVDVWEDAATWQAAFGSAEAQAAFQQAGIPEPTSVEIYPTHNVEQAS